MALNTEKNYDGTQGNLIKVTTDKRVKSFKDALIGANEKHLPQEGDMLPCMKQPLAPDMRVEIWLWISMKRSIRKELKV